jgi:hypothetical protein
VRRADRLAQIERVRAEHPELTDREKATLLGISLSAYRNVVNDPDGSKQRARRDTYTGTCEKCGAETRSDGTSKASPLCVPCAKAEQTVWTREKIIEAIQAFASLHGRRPASSEWLYGPHDGYPWTTTVLARFGSWANGVEAAGFERPKLGVYVKRPRGSLVEYFVFRMNGTAELVGMTEARSVVEAIGQLADGEGRYGAVSSSAVQIRDVRRQLAVVRPAEAEPVDK